MEKENRIVIVVGRKGTGKSTYLRRATKDAGRLIFIDTMNEHRVGVVVYDKSTLYEIVTSNRLFRVVYRPLDEDGVEYALWLAIAVGRLIVVIDEIDRWCSSYYLSPALRWLVNYGRHYGVSLVGATRMPNRIRTDIMAMVDQIVAFQSQGAALRAIQEFASEDVSYLASIPPYEYRLIL